MVTIITYTELDFHQRSDDVKFFLREYSEEGAFSRHLRQPQLHTVVSKEFTNQETARRLKAFREDSTMSAFEFVHIPYGKNKSFIHAIGPRSQRHNLPAEFYTDHEDGKGDPNGVDSPSRLVRWNFSPLSIVEQTGNLLLNTGNRIGLEKILNDRICTIDPELGRWETNEPYIMMVIFYTGNPRFGNYLLTVFDPGVPVIRDAKVEVFNSHANFRQDQADLLTRLSELERTYDPLWVAGHNIPQDKKWLRDLPDEVVYLPGVDVSKPVVKSARRTSKTEAEEKAPKIDIRKTITRGRFTIDTYRHARTYFNYLQDNRLETHATRAGFPYSKIISYKELTELTRRAELGDRDAARTIAEYAVMDGEASLALAKHMLPNIVVKMDAFHVDSDTVCSNSRLVLAYDRWKRHYFMQTKTFDDRKFRKYYPTEGSPQQGQEDTKVSLEKLAMEIIEREISAAGKVQVLQRRSGFFRDVHVVYLTPFIMAFAPVIKSDPDLTLLFDEMDRREGDLKIDLAQTINAALATPTLKLRDFLMDAGYQLGAYIHHPNDIPKEAVSRAGYTLNLGVKDWIFGRTYGIDMQFDGRWANHWTINRNLVYAFYGYNTKGILGLLDELDVINYTDTFLFLRGDLEKVRQLERLNMVAYLGTGPAISTTTIYRGKTIRNRVIAKVGNTPIYQGFMPKAGKKTKFEIEVALDFIDRALNGAFERDLYSFLDSRLLELEGGMVPRQNLLYRSSGNFFGTVKYGPHSVELEAEKFLTSRDPVDVWYYKDSLRRNFGDIFYVTLRSLRPKLDALLGARKQQLSLPFAQLA